MEIHEHWLSFPMFIILLALNELMILKVDEVVFLVIDCIARICAVSYLDLVMKIKVQYG